MKYITIRSKLILGIIALIIITHIVTLISYTREHNSSRHQIDVHNAIERIMHLVDLAQTEPYEKLDQMLPDFNNKQFTLSLTNTPQTHLQIRNPSYLEVRNAIHKDTNQINLSLLIHDKFWLNMQIQLDYNIWKEQFWLFLLEIIILGVVSFYLWSISRFTHPLNDFRAAAEQLGVDIHTKLPNLPYKGPFIVQETAVAIRKLQTRIQELLNARTQMLAAISHDLRTPITRLKLRAHCCKDPDVQQKMIEDLDEMEFMITDILDFARSNYTKETPVKMDLNSLLQSICDDLIDQEKDVEYISSEKHFVMFSRPITLKRIFNNLILNALKYGKLARVKAQQIENKFVITIEDNGPGIPEKELANVFMPFYRCDQSRSQNIPGTGLGLTIARDAIIALGGIIELVNRPEGGLKATVTLPATHSN